MPIEHIEAITGEPTILVKGSDVKAMSNICTHRGMRLVTQPCTNQPFSVNIMDAHSI